MKTSYLLALAASAALAACTTDDAGPGSGGPAPSNRGAEHAFSSADTAISTAARSVGSRLTAPLAGTVNVSAACSRGGTVALAGSFDTSGTGTSFDVDATFAACAEAEGTLGGNLHWTSKIEGARIEDSWRGTLSFADATGTYSCTFDLTSIVDPTGVHYSGSLCGYDVQTDLNL
jgi:hypothetical protein